MKMIVQDLKERLTNDGIASYQWIPTDLMWADALRKEMKMNENMKSMLIEGVFHLEDHEINKVKCIDGEIRMINIRNRENTLDHKNMLV